MAKEATISKQHNIPWLKLAVAVAILRNKPAEMSGRKYTEDLQAQFLSSQSLLQGKYYQAKMQILQLEQKLAMSSINHGSEMPYCSSIGQQLQDAVMEKPATDLFSGSAGCGVDENYREACMLENHKFMHSVIELQGLARRESGKGTDQLLESSVTHIKSLRTVMGREVMLLSESCMCKGAESVMAMIENAPWVGDRPEFMQEVCLLVESIINLLTQPSNCGLSQIHRQKKALVNMLVVFMKGKVLPLLSCILESLIESTEAFCQKLEMSQLLSEPLDPDLFENGFYVMHGLKLTMELWSNDCGLQTSVLQEAQAKLERALMQILHCFPLVAQALMQITTLIELILQKGRPINM